jgi:O-antigen/teichoic acid export membrane protein
MVWTFLGVGFYTACQWGILVVIARLGGPENVGKFGISLAVTAPVVIFCNLSLRQVLVTDSEGTKCFSDYFCIRILSTLFGLLLIGILAFWGQYQNGTASVIIAVGLSKAFEAISDIFYGLQQRNERFDIVAGSLILRGALGVLSLAFAMWMTRSLVIGVCAMAGTWGLVLLVYDVPFSHKIRSRTTPLEKKAVPLAFLAKRRPKIVWIALPLGLSTLLASLTTNIPSYFIEYYLGESSLGLFVAMAYFPAIGARAIIAIGQTALPRLSKAYASKEYERWLSLMKKMHILALAVGMGGVLGTLFWGEHLVILVYGKKFIYHETLLIALMIGGLVNYLATVAAFGAISTRAFWLQYTISFLNVMVSLIVCKLFLLRHGLILVAILWLGTYSLKFLGNFLITLRIFSGSKECRH